MQTFLGCRATYHKLCTCCLKQNALPDISDKRDYLHSGGQLLKPCDNSIPQVENTEKEERTIQFSNYN